MRKYPIGIQEFREIREKNYLYVDKTEIIYALADAGKYYFLSRPRRFGKSLLVSTLKELFLGRKELFEGLWIENQWEKWEKHPIIHIDFSSLGYKKMTLDKAIEERLQEIATTYGIQLRASVIALQFRELIMQLSSQNKVVVLVDEYDKPIIDFLDDVPKAEEHRETLKDFYSVLKSLDNHLRFVLLTGVSKFAKVSIFSELNNLNDLTLKQKYANLVGYTKEEIESCFDQDIQELAIDQNMSATELLTKIAEWYNGYSWDGKFFLYNPFSILNLFESRQFHNYWFSTGTPTFLVKLLNKDFLFDFEFVEAGREIFDSYRLDKINPKSLYL